MGLGWNYRIIYHPPYKYMVSDTEFDGTEYYAIHEVWYDSEGVPDSYAIDPLIYDDTEEGLSEIWDMVKKGIKKEVINISFFKEKT